MHGWIKDIGKKIQDFRGPVKVKTHVFVCVKVDSVDLHRDG